jgi:hypothetical protein
MTKLAESSEASEMRTLGDIGGQVTAYLATTTPGASI